MLERISHALFPRYEGEERALHFRLVHLVLRVWGIALAACLAGLMTPLWAAIAMPVSSVSLLVFTIASLSPRRSARPADPAPAGALEGVPAWTP